jgi:hypothetical protein
MTKNLQLETFCAVSKLKEMSEGFGDKLYYLIVDNDVKRIIVDWGEYDNDKDKDKGLYREVLLEDDCYLEFIDKNVVKVHSPSSKLNYPYRHLTYNHTKFDVRYILKVNKIVELYCDIYINIELHKYIYYIVFNKKVAKWYIENLKYYKFIDNLLYEVLVNDQYNTIFFDEYNYDSFNELVKNIYLKKIDYYRKHYDEKYNTMVNDIFHSPKKLFNKTISKLSNKSVSKLFNKSSLKLFNGSGTSITNKSIHQSVSKSVPKSVPKSVNKLISKCFIDLKNSK